MAVVALLALAGCGGHGNRDPRKGRVTTHSSDCLTGDCTWDWKVCIGPDLLVHIDGVKPDHTLYNSPECRP